MHLYRTFIKGICCEIGIAKNPRATIVYCPGLPGIPKDQSLLKQLTKEGYNTIYPRYKGTFESEGTFLENSPVLDILNVVEYCRNNSFVELYAHSTLKIEPAPVIFMGSSFGGSIAILASHQLPQSASVILCPVTDFSDQGSREYEQDLKELQKFLTQGFPNVYRISTSGYENMLLGNLFPTLSSIIPLHKNPVILYHGKNDKTISPTRIKELPKNDLIEVRFIKGEHLKFSEIPFERLTTDLDELLQRMNH